ncbi:MAG: PilW family protein [Gammaproteobacteria bacterium]|nr:PilW family protein [Gammaproteobacteria bacterium]
MSATRSSPDGRRGAPRQRGFSLIELLVTVAIALFLMDGLVTIVQNMRKTYSNQQALAQLQDQQRFAMTVMTDVIQAGGYYPNPLLNTESSALPPGGPWVGGQALWGTTGGAPPGDTIGVRYMTAGGDGVIVCTGATNGGPVGSTHTYTNIFGVVVGAQGGQLVCQLDGGPLVPLVNGVTNLTIYFGVKRNFATSDYNVDTYLTANNMQPADWSNISSVRILLTFTNPLWPQPGQASPTITFERVVEVMGRGGVHT